MSNGSETARPPFAVRFPPTPHGLPVPWVRVAVVLVLVSLVLQHGFQIGVQAFQWLTWLDGLLALAFAADLVLAGFRDQRWKRVYQLRAFEYWLLALFVALLAGSSVLPQPVLEPFLEFFHLQSAAGLRLNFLNLFLLLVVFVQLLRGAQRLFDKGFRPELILAGSFAALVVTGTLLLLLPNASVRTQPPIHFVDALFTATSAVCVTGLIVRDTGAAFSSFGQTIILVLIQVGGLGIITFVAFLSVFSTRVLPVPQMVAFRQIVNAPTMSELKRQIVGILLVSGVIELAGTFLLYAFLPASGDPLRQIKWSVFHAVSAFCNAGFALQSDSLTQYRANPGMMCTFMTLIVLGGLGFLVVPELLRFRITRARFFRRFDFFRRLHSGQAPGQLSVQAKLSLWVTFLLLMAGLFAFWGLESGHLLRGHPAGESFLISAFQSVTPRTAGFNTVPVEQLQNTTLLLLMMLMVIGSSPVSTGGGIKTVSFGILLLSLRAMVMRRERVEAFGRTIPTQVLFAALSVFVLYVLSAGLGIFLLAWFDPRLPLQDEAFEVISALSTVGLSRGITGELSVAGKLVLCVAMFVGRVGPISLVLAVFQSRRALAYEFPEEQVVVG